MEHGGSEAIGVPVAMRLPGASEHSNRFSSKDTGSRGPFSAFGNCRVILTHRVSSDYEPPLRLMVKHRHSRELPPSGFVPIPSNPI